MTARTLKALGKSGESKDICACFTTRKAARAITRFYSEVVGKELLGSSQHSLLQIAYLTGVVTINRMAQLAEMDRTTLTRNLKPLLREKLVTICPGRDRRERQVEITERGVVYLRKSMRKWEQAQIAFERKLGGRRFDEYIAILKDMMERIKG